jgi:hypothetical protein
MALLSPFEKKVPFLENLKELNRKTMNIERK